MVNISVSTFNCRGLNSENKRRRIYNKFKNNEVTFLQESYITDVKASEWNNYWNGLFFYSAGTNNSKGLITLVKCDFLKDPAIFYRNDRVLGIKGKVDGDYFFFINVYGPTIKKERPKFMSDLYNCLGKCSTDKIIIGGDFNLMFDCEVDNIAGEKHDDFSTSNFRNWAYNNELIDCWRNLHGDEKDFTWWKNEPYIARRLDYIFITESLHHLLLKSHHEFFTGTDHKIVHSILSSNNGKRGQGYWKFNNALLLEKEYVELMNNKIDAFFQNKYDDDLEAFEYLKIMVKAETIAYSSMRKASTEEKTKFLLKELDKYSKLLNSDPSNETYDKKFVDIKKELDIIELHKARGARVRAKIKEVEEGERNTKYFLGMEKHRGSNSTINKLTVNNNEITNQQEILGALKEHFQNLGLKNESTLSSVENIEQFLQDVDANKISDIDKHSLDNPLTLEEVGKALSLLDNDSSPGIDGLTASWYKFFFKKIKTLLFKCLQQVIQEGELGISQKLGVVTLLHKGKELRKDLIKNWRPITVTNCDYKIFSKCIALRLQKILHLIIDKNQTGFMKGRNIAEHIRIIDDIINLSDKLDLPGCIVSLDFEKAFDSLSKETILSALKYFNFGDYFVNLVETLLKNSESAISNNGWLSPFFEVNRGVRQGCPASPLLFLITVELLAIKIRANETIKGISFKNNTVDTIPLKILQYCDDATLLLNSPDELPKAFEIIDNFYKLSGLKLNINKSIGFGIGATKDITGNPFNIQWKKRGENTRILGVYFNSVQEASDIEENWTTKMEKIRELAIKLNRRQVSLWGRVLLCKTFLLSQISFNIQALSMPKKYIEELEGICFRFIWQKNNSREKIIEKIKRQVMCFEKNKGGAGMIKCGSQQSLFLLKWILRVNIQSFESMFSTSKIPDFYFSYYGGIENFRSFTCKLSELPISDLLSRFWRDAIKSWLILKHNIKIISETDPNHTTCKDLFGPLHQEKIPMFLNSDIRYSNKIMLYHGWINRGLIFLHQVQDENGDIIQFNSLPENVKNLPDSIFILNAIRAVYLRIKRSSQDPIAYLTKNYLVQEKMLKLQNSKLRSIIEYDAKIVIYGKRFWDRKLEMDIFPKYICSLKSVKETQLQVTLFKLFHNILPSKILLKKWKKEESDFCECGERDFIEHSIALCRYKSPLWNEVKQIILLSTGLNLHLSVDRKLFGLSFEDKQTLKISTKSLYITNYILALAKFCINKARVQNLGLRLCFETEWNFRKDSILQTEQDDEV